MGPTTRFLQRTNSLFWRPCSATSSSSAAIHSQQFNNSQLHSTAWGLTQSRRAGFVVCSNLGITQGKRAFIFFKIVCLISCMHAENVSTSANKFTVANMLYWGNFVFNIARLQWVRLKYCDESHFYSGEPMCISFSDFSQVC